MDIMGAVTCGVRQVIDRNYYPVAARHSVAQHGADLGSGVIQSLIYTSCMKGPI